MSTKARRDSSAALVFGIEWPTLLVWFLCWMFFLALTANHPQIHPALFVLLSSLVAAWHTSFQHESIHGHPTKFERVNRALATPSMALWLPFEDYRTSHLAHHVNENLTHPDHDPESFYVWQAQWEAMGGWRRALMGVSNTLVGRLTVGALMSIGNCLVSHTLMLAKLDRKTWVIVTRHLAFSLPPAILALVVFDLPLWLYLVGFQFGAAFWLSLRSFLEHEAASGVGRRTAIVYDALLPPTAWFTGFFSLLFLNNNLHAAHHLEPRMPWYQLPRFVHENRAKLLEWNQGNQFSGYGEVAARFGLRSIEPVVHPVLTPQRASVRETAEILSER